jgi:hypothetical protein
MIVNDDRVDALGSGDHLFAFSRALCLADPSQTSVSVVLPARGTGLFVVLGVAAFLRRRCDVVCAGRSAGDRSDAAHRHAQRAAPRRAAIGLGFDLRVASPKTAASAVLKTLRSCPSLQLDR